MSTNFDRNRAQLRCEALLGCSRLEDWPSVDFQSLTLSEGSVVLLKGDLEADARDYYFKGLLSLVEALVSVRTNLYSWATVKLYYSLYYFLRCSLALDGVAVIRHKSLYYLKSVIGDKPIRRNGKHFNSDHSGTIHLSILHFESDILISQNIDGHNPYLWLMQRREQVNYRERCFQEPGCASFWEEINDDLGTLEFPALIGRYIDDEYLLCFQEEHAILGLPIKRALLTRAQFETKSLPTNLGTDRKTLLQSIGNKSPNLLTALF